MFPATSHPWWSLSPFEHPVAPTRDASFPMSVRAKQTRYPLRAMRYWFMYHLIEREFARLQRPLDVLEVGVDRGQMLRFMQWKSAEQAPGQLPPSVGNWVALSLDANTEELRDLGYSAVHQRDVCTEPPHRDEQYDVIIALHVLEHINAPEQTVARLAENLRPGGVIIGGYPSVPDLIRPLREKVLRSGPSRFGHVSKFSVGRTRQMATQAKLNLEWVSGAFCRRHNGSFLENYRWWTRFNLWFGATFPRWPGELYWLMRKA